ncbi:MAG: cytochrome c family protein [Candidatus Marinimicrobia bacterium]|nr:cytochrome c family protein [Candidatus Neomarinimicrobiota bacterium]
MKRLFTLLLILACVGIFAQGKPIKNVGSKKCKICHNKAEKGSQYKIWESRAHSRSYETLLTDESKKIAAKQGLKTAPEKSPECLRCHVTGWGEAGGYSLDIDETNARAVKKNKDLSRVGCESCHGPGNAYKSKKTMLKIRSGDIDAKNLGYVKIDEATCTKCHNPDSPTYIPFDYAVRVKEIDHPYPE